MKKSILVLIPLFLSPLALASCGPTQGDRLVSTAYVIPDDSEAGIRRTPDAFHLLYRGESDVPYISLDEGFAFLNAIKASRYDDAEHQKHYFRLTQSDNVANVIDESGAKATFDLNAQTITFVDFDSFVSMTPDGQQPLQVLNTAKSTKAIQVSSSRYVAGHDLVIDLKPYSAIELVSYKEQFYLPVGIFNDVFVNAIEYFDLAFNGNELFFVPDGGFYVNLGGEKTLSPLGTAFFGVSERKTLSKAYAEFNYQQACFDFDNIYGLRKDKGFISFAAFIKDKGFEGDFLSSDTARVDAAWQMATSHLIDGHTALTGKSPFYKEGLPIDNARMNQKKLTWQDGSEALQKKRIETARTYPAAAEGNYLDPTGNVYYITFNEFTPNNEAVIYDKEEQTDPAAIKVSTALQFASAYRFLVDEANKGKANTVVVDLTTNDGGSSDALIFATCSLIGEFSVWMQNPITGAKNQSSYKADVNLDGKIDEKDVGLIDEGYNVVFLNSEYTFSCGNAMPFYAKENRSKVMTVGETSGGGACVVRPGVNALGSTYYASGLGALSVERDSSLVNIDKGIPAEHAIAKDSFFNREFTTAMINGWLQAK